MSIAQRFVAGEGDLYPAHSESTTPPSDSDALAAFRSDAVNLPWVIFRAAFRAAHVQQLPQRARCVLAALARTVDSEKPFAAIFARRELLTGRSMQSMRTFYRSLDDLEAAGFIERRAQSRYVEAGLFGRAYLHLTDRAAALLGFVETPAVNGGNTSLVVPTSPSSAPADQAAAARDHSLTGPSATVADGAIYKDLIPKDFQKRQPGQLPSDLQRLRSLGFIDFLIFKLMREARENGKRLSDVVEATWEHLKAAQAPINYLRALLRSPVDFAHQVRSRTAKHAEERALDDRAVRADYLARQSAGKTFVDSSGQRTYVVSDDGQAMTVYAIQEGVARQAADWKQKFAEAHDRGHIRPAAHADLEAFAQARRDQVTRAGRVGPLGLEKPKVTAQVRDHIAGLRNILRPHSHPSVRGG